MSPNGTRERPFRCGSCIEPATYGKDGRWYCTGHWLLMVMQSKPAMIVADTCARSGAEILTASKEERE